MEAQEKCRARLWGACGGSGLQCVGECAKQGSAAGEWLKQRGSDRRRLQRALGVEAHDSGLWLGETEEQGEQGSSGSTEGGGGGGGGGGGRFLMEPGR